MVTWMNTKNIVTSDDAFATYATDQTTTTLTLDSTHYIVFCDTTSNTVTITLPDVGANEGKRYFIVFETDGGNNLTVDCAGSDTFLGVGQPAGGNQWVGVDKDDYLEIIAVKKDGSTPYWLVVGMGNTNAGFP